VRWLKEGIDELERLGSEDVYAAYMNLGHALRNLGDYEGSVRAYDKALEGLTDRDDVASCLMDKAVALAEIGRYEDALKALERAIEIRKSGEEYIYKDSLIGALYNKALILAKMGRIREAEEIMKEALETCTREYEIKEAVDFLITPLYLVYNALFLGLKIPKALLMKILDHISAIYPFEVDVSKELEEILMRALEGL